MLTCRKWCSVLGAWCWVLGCRVLGCRVLGFSGVQLAAGGRAAFSFTDMVRKAAVAGSWYPGSAAALAAAVDRYLSAVDRKVAGDVTALIAPHAGLMYSGPVAAH